MFAGFRAAIPHILAGGGGAIVSTASISGTRPAAGEAPYAASKAAVAALTASAALEYAPHIRVNAVSPGMIRTAMTAPMFEFFPDQEQAHILAFLNSDMASYITGANVFTDGGFWAGFTTNRLGF